MGLGRLTPGCGCGCTCTGSFTVTECTLSWTTSGAYQVEVRLESGGDSFLISTNQTGSLNNPNDATFSLWVRCSAGGELVEVDSVDWVRAAPGTCDDCCTALGYDSSGHFIPIVISTTGDDIFGFFDGTYGLTQDTICTCLFQGSFPFDDLVGADCGTVDLGDECTFNGSLFANAFYLGTRSFSLGGDPPTATFDVYGFPTLLTITWKVPNDSVDCDNSYSNTIEIVMEFNVWGFLTSTSNGENAPCCVYFGQCAYVIILNLLECGATSVCDSYSDTNPCDGLVPALYEGYNIGGTFTEPELLTVCAEILR